jgi:cytochrome P450
MDIRVLVNMDPPEHRNYRKLVSGWFTPRAISRLEARLDLKIFWRQFAARFESIELGGPVELLHASFVAGPKHIPVRYKIRPARA